MSDFEFKVCVQHLFEIEIFLRCVVRLHMKFKGKRLKNKSVTNVNDTLNTPWIWKQRDHSPIHLHPMKLIQFCFSFNSKELGVFQLRGRLRFEMVQFMRITSYEWSFEKDQRWLYFMLNIRWNQNWIHFWNWSSAIKRNAWGVNINKFVCIIRSSQTKWLYHSIDSVAIFIWLNE